MLTVTLSLQKMVCWPSTLKYDVCKEGVCVCVCICYIHAHIIHVRVYVCFVFKLNMQMYVLFLG